MFNGATTIRAAVDSVIGQSVQAWHLVIVDDGSTDETASLARGYAADDPRITYLADGEHLGLVARLNQLAALTETPYLARLDADDIMHPERLAKQLAHLDAHAEVNVLATGAWVIDEEGRVYAARHLSPLASTHERVLRNDFLLHPTVTARTRWFREYPYDERYLRGEDKELWCRTWTPTTFARLPEPLLWYRAGRDVRVPTYRTGCRTDRMILRRYGPEVVGWPRTVWRLALSLVREAITVAAAGVGVGGVIIRMRSGALPSVERRYAQRLHDKVVRGSETPPAFEGARPLPTRITDGLRYLAPLAVERAPGRRRRRAAAARRPVRATTEGVGPPVTLLAVYRRRNAELVSRLVESAGQGATVGLWALDEPHPSLAGYTVGSGPGAKFALLDALWAEVRPDDDGYVVVADDDVALLDGDLGALVAAGARHRLDLFQPSHSWLSIYSHAFLLSRPWYTARRTTFVEIGPLFVVGPGWRNRLLPFGSDVGMGWGLEVAWYGLSREGCRLGVVDDCRMLHLGAVGAGYDTGAQALRTRQLLHHIGARSVSELMRAEERWWRLPLRR